MYRQLLFSWTGGLHTRRIWPYKTEKNCFFRKAFLLLVAINNTVLVGLFSGLNPPRCEALAMHEEDNRPSPGDFAQKKIPVKQDAWVGAEGYISLYLGLTWISRKIYEQIFSWAVWSGFPKSPGADFQLLSTHGCRQVVRKAQLPFSHLNKGQIFKNAEHPAVPTVTLAAWFSKDLSTQLVPNMLQIFWKADPYSKNDASD